MSFLRNMLSHPATLNIKEHKKRDTWDTTFDFLKDLSPSKEKITIPDSPFAPILGEAPRSTHPLLFPTLGSKGSVGTTGPKAHVPTLRIPVNKTPI